MPLSFRKRVVLFTGFCWMLFPATCTSWTNLLRFITWNLRYIDKIPGTGRIFRRNLFYPVCSLWNVRLRHPKKKKNNTRINSYYVYIEIQHRLFKCQFGLCAKSKWRVNVMSEFMVLALCHDSMVVLSLYI